MVGRDGERKRGGGVWGSQEGGCSPSPNSSAWKFSSTLRCWGTSNWAGPVLCATGRTPPLMTAFMDIVAVSRLWLLTVNGGEGNKALTMVSPVLMAFLSHLQNQGYWVTSPLNGWVNWGLGLPRQLLCSRILLCVFPIYFTGKFNPCSLCSQPSLFLSISGLPSSCYPHPTNVSFVPALYQLHPGRQRQDLEHHIRYKWRSRNKWLAWDSSWEGHRKVREQGRGYAWGSG